MTDNAYRYGLAVSVALFASSLIFPTLCVPEGCGWWPGWRMLAFGWFGWLGGIHAIANWAWLANVTLVVAWLMIGRQQRFGSIAGSVLASLLAILPIVSPRWIDGEGNYSETITGYALGYWLWVGAIIAAVCSSLMISRSPNK